MDYEIFVSGDKVIVPGVIDTPMTREDALRLAEAIKRNCEPQETRKDAVRRLYIAGLPLKKIAEQTGYTPKSVRTMVTVMRDLPRRQPQRAARMRGRPPFVKAAAE